MAGFVRGAAVLVGVANISACVLIGSSDDLLGDFASPEMRPYLLLYALFGAVAGLLTAEILLKLSRRALLRSGFFTRYAAMMLGTCVGGALTGALFLVTSSLIFSGFSAGVPAYWLLLDIFAFGVYAGLFGLLEGVLVGLPLAAILGSFTGREAIRR